MIEPQPCSRNSSSPQLSDPAPQGNHITVLREIAVESLRPREGSIYVDGTFGGGGHAQRLLAHDPPIGLVIAIDADLDAGPRARYLANRPGNSGRLRLYHRNFRDLASVVEEAAVPQVNGVLLDLGLSSFQLDQGERGFSFRHDAPLDMRFDQTGGITAADLVNTADVGDLARILWQFGEEKQSRRIASAIIREREKSPIRTTIELASLVQRIVGGGQRSRIHPATRTFQALRIAVNGELDALAEVMQAATGVLSPGGRLVVIAFHSLEDRIVKRFIEAESRTCVCPPDQPICTCDTIPRLVRVGKPIRPSKSELSLNPRSRSAIMRVAERLDLDGNLVH